MHELLMERGRIIDRLIEIKARQGGGSAFRPAREASMMRALVERHRGLLPLDTVEGIWRIIISTFTFMCRRPIACMSMFRAAMPRCAIRPASISASRCPAFRIIGAAGVIEAVARAAGDLGMFAVDGGVARRRLVDAARAAARAQDHRPAAVRRAAGPSRGHAGLRDRQAAGGGAARDVVLEAVGSIAGAPDYPQALAAIGGGDHRRGGQSTGLALLVSRPGDLDGARASATLRQAGAADVRSVEIGAHAAASTPGIASPTPQAIETAMSHPPARPPPRPEILAIDAYVPGKSGVDGVAKIHKLSSNESPLGPSPKAVEAFRAGRTISRSIPTARRRRLREASARRYGLDPARILCGNGSDECWPCWRMSFSPRRRRALQPIWVPRIPDRDPGRGRRPGRREGDGPHRERRCAARQGRRQDADRVPRQSQQSDRHLSSLFGGQAAACGAAADVCWCSTRPTPNMCSATITPPASNWSRSCENVVMTRTFSKIHGLAALAHRLGLRAGASRRRGQPGARPIQRQRRRDRGRRRRLEDAAHVEAAIAHNPLAALARRGDRRAWASA